MSLKLNTLSPLYLLLYKIIYTLSAQANPTQILVQLEDSLPNVEVKTKSHRNQSVIAPYWGRYNETITTRHSYLQKSNLYCILSFITVQQLKKKIVLESWNSDGIFFLILLKWVDELTTQAMLSGCRGPRSSLRECRHSA